MSGNEAGSVTARSELVPADIWNDHEGVGKTDNARGEREQR
jgi:hypothetical protein